MEVVVVVMVVVMVGMPGAIMHLSWSNQLCEETLIAVSRFQIV